MSLKIHQNTPVTLNRPSTPPSLKPETQTAVKAIDAFFERVGKMKDIDQNTADVSIMLGELKGRIQSGEETVDNVTLKLIQLATSTMYTGK